MKHFANHKDDKKRAHDTLQLVNLANGGKVSFAININGESLDLKSTSQIAITDVTMEVDEILEYAQTIENMLTV